MSDFHRSMRSPGFPAVRIRRRSFIECGQGRERKKVVCMQVAAIRKLPRMFLINKIDSAPMSIWEHSSNDLREKRSVRICLPIKLRLRPQVLDRYFRKTDGTRCHAFSSAKVAHTDRRIGSSRLRTINSRKLSRRGSREISDPKRLHEAIEKALCEGHPARSYSASAITQAAASGTCLHDDRIGLFAESAREPRRSVSWRTIPSANPQLRSRQTDESLMSIRCAFGSVFPSLLGKLGIFTRHHGMTSRSAYPSTVAWLKITG